MLKFYIKYFITKIRVSFGRGKIFDSKIHEPTAIIFSCPDHGNLGDVAIEYAEEKILSDKYKIVAKVYVNNLWKYLKNVRKNISQEDIVCIQGGGSFGGLYPQADLERIILFNELRTKIISFPQSITYERNEYSWIYRKSLKKRNNVYMYFRDKKSYDIAISDFSFMKDRIFCVPDIVMSLKEDNNRKTNRNGVIVSFRSDKEKFISDKIKHDIEDKLVKKYKKIKKLDTIISLKKLDDQYPELEKLLNEYRQSELVVTDRLHGMILAYITNTPCIAFSNSNGKIKNMYNTWLSDSNIVNYFDEYIPNIFEETVKSIEYVEDPYNRDKNMTKYEKLMKEL